MEEADVEFVAECTFHRCVEEFCASHGGAVGECNDDFFTGTVAFDKVSERLQQRFGARLVSTRDGCAECFLEVGDFLLSIGNADGS